MGGMHAAVFFVDVLNLKSAVAALPIAHQYGGIVSGTVIHNEPEKILTTLSTETLIGARQRMRPVIGGREDGEDNISGVVHKHLCKTPVIWQLPL